MTNEYRADQIYFRDIEQYFSQKHVDEYYTINNYTLNYAVTDYIFSGHAEISEYDINIFYKNCYKNEKIDSLKEIEHKKILLPLNDNSKTNIIIPFNMISSMVNYVCVSDSLHKKFLHFFKLFIEDKKELIDQDMHNYIIHKLSIFKKYNFLDMYLNLIHNENNLTVNSDFIQKNIPYTSDKKIYEPFLIRYFHTRKNNFKDIDLNVIALLFKYYNKNSCKNIFLMSRFSIINYFSEYKKFNDIYFALHNKENAYKKFLKFLKNQGYDFSNDNLSDYSKSFYESFEFLMKNNIQHKGYVEQFLNNKDLDSGKEELKIYLNYTKNVKADFASPEELFTFLNEKYKHCSEEESCGFLIRCDIFFSEFIKSGAINSFESLDSANGLAARLYILFVKKVFTYDSVSVKKLATLFNDFNPVIGLLNKIEHEMKKAHFGFSDLLTVISIQALTYHRKDIFYMSKDDFNRLNQIISFSNPIYIHFCESSFFIIYNAIMANKDKDYLRNNKDIYIKILDIGYSLFKDHRFFTNRYPAMIVDVSEALYVDITKEDSALFEMISFILTNQNFQVSDAAKLLTEQKVLYEQLFLKMNNTSNHIEKSKIKRI